MVVRNLLDSDGWIWILLRYWIFTVHFTGARSTSTFRQSSWAEVQAGAQRRWKVNVQGSCEQIQDTFYELLHRVIPRPWWVAASTPTSIWSRYWQTSLFLHLKELVVQCTVDLAGGILCLLTEILTYNLKVVK